MSRVHQINGVAGLGCSIGRSGTDGLATGLPRSFGRGSTVVITGRITAVFAIGQTRGTRWLQLIAFRPPLVANFTASPRV